MISITRITALTPKRLSKRFTLVAGVLLKEGGGNMTEGVGERLTFASPEEFADLLPTLRPNQAITYGIPKYDRTKIVAKDKAVQASSDLPIITRTRDHFSWPDGPGVMMLDYDPPPDRPAFTCDELVAALVEACPALSTAPIVWRPSASSCIYAGEQELRGITGQRLYVFVQTASDISRAGQALFRRLWLVGHGRCELSKSGALLERSPIDSSVFQPERLDFCGGAECGKGLVQRLPAPQLLNSGAELLDTALIPDLTPAEQSRLATIQSAAKRALEPDQARIRDAWIADRVQERTSKLPTADHAKATPVLTKVYRDAAYSGRLAPDFELTVTPKGTR